MLILAMFVVTLGAGASAGMLYERRDSCHHLPPLNVRFQALHLTSEQERKMQEIWTPISTLHLQRRMRRDEMLKTRDAATLAILTDEQKTKFAVIQKSFDDQVQHLDQEIKTREDEAVTATNNMLNDDQRAKFAALRKERDDFMNTKPK
jgi:hypothetical protein